MNTATLPPRPWYSFAPDEEKKQQPVALWEHGLAVMWLLVTFIPFPGDTALLYLMVLIFLSQLVLRRVHTVPLALKCLPIFFIPFMMLFSASYSEYSSDAFRQGILMTLSALSVIAIAQRLSGRQVIRAMFLAGTVAVIFALPSYETFSRGGLYGSKNLFGIQMLYVLVAALSVLVNKNEYAWVRLIAIPIVPITMFFVYISDSATALIMMIVSVLGILVLGRAWPWIARVLYLRSFLVLSIAITLTALLIQMANMPGGLSLDSLLQLVGRDSTFTGRTTLWSIGDMVADENPIWGVGGEGFWQYDVGTAQTLNVLDHKPIGTRLSFHNVYLEIRVHFGYVGLTLLLLAFAWIMSAIVISWLRNPTTERGTFLIAALVALSTSFTESWLMGGFTSTVFFFSYGAVTAIHNLRESEPTQVYQRVTSGRFESAPQYR